MRRSLHPKPTVGCALWTSLAALSFSASMLACGEKLDPVQIGDGRCELVDPVVWEGALDAVFATHCAGCHAEIVVGVDRRGAPAGVDFGRYEAAAAHVDRAFARMSDGSMPPPGPARVSACLVDGVRRWIELGTPRTEADL